MSVFLATHFVLVALDFFKLNALHVILLSELISFFLILVIAPHIAIMILLITDVRSVTLYAKNALALQTLNANLAETLSQSTTSQPGVFQAVMFL